MARIHLAWELGNGLGHVGRLKPLAVELARRGHEITMSLRDLVGTRSAWQSLDIPCLQAPVFLHNTVGLPKRTASLAEIALGFGFLDADVLGSLAGGWRALLSAVGASLMVADYAPTATLAARSLGIPAMSIGLGFSVPPVGRPLPSFRPAGELEPGRLEAAEARFVQSANRVLRAVGGREVTQAWELFCGDRALLCNWAELDCYARGPLPEGETWYGASFDPGAGVAPAWPAGTGPRAIAYLKGGYRELPAVLAALAERGYRTLCYVPDVEAGRPAPFRHPLIAYSDRPVNLAAALAESDLCVCHAGGGTIAQALLAGVPLLLLPMQDEQKLNARSVERLGAGIGVMTGKLPVDFAAPLSRLLGDGGFRDVARAFARRHRDFSHGRQTAELCDAIERTVPSGPNAVRATAHG